MGASQTATVGNDQFAHCACGTVETQARYADSRRIGQEQGIASAILNLTKVTLPGRMPPSQLLLTFHKPLVSDKLSAGFQRAFAGGR